MPSGARRAEPGGKMGRKLTLRLGVTKGRIHDFSATVDADLVISGDGTRMRAFSRPDMPDTPVKVRVITAGVPGSEYVIAVDLPDTGDGFVWKYTLDTPIQEVEFDV